MTDDERVNLREWMEERLDRVEHRLERIERSVGEHVTWKALGTVILVAVAVATLILTIAGGR